MLLARIQLKKTKQLWRSRNTHNQTHLESLTNPDLIQVGKYSYGGLKVLNASEDRRLKIGHFCSIAGNVTFVVCSDHPTDRISTFPFKVMCLQTRQHEAGSKGDIVLADDVWIGQNATILSGVHIGQGAVIAAGAVVSKNVPPYAIVGGVPAKVIKYRFEPELIEELLKVDYGKLTKEMVALHENDLYQELKDIKQLDWMPRKDTL